MPGRYPGQGDPTRSLPSAPVRPIPRHEVPGRVVLAVGLIMSWTCVALLIVQLVGV
jgi:hypothetical protein